MSTNTKYYSSSQPNAPKLYNNSKWGELIRVIRYAVNGGVWDAITKIEYHPEKDYIRVYLDNTNFSKFTRYQTIQFNGECGVFSNKEAIIMGITTQQIDVKFHDDIPELADSAIVLESSDMNVRLAKLGFTEAYTDRDCGVFKTENHDFYFCLNDNNPSNDDHTFLTKNTMMTRPTVYMCEGMDGIHNNLGAIFPYDPTYPTAHIGGNAFKFVNSTLWQNGLFGWDYQIANGATNTALTEVRWILVGNGDNIILMFDNQNGDANQSWINVRNRVYFFQVVHNGETYTPIMNGVPNSLFQNYYTKTNSSPQNSNSYHYIDTTFGLKSGSYSIYDYSKIHKYYGSDLSNLFMLKNNMTTSPSSMILYPEIYASSRYSGLYGGNFDNTNRELCRYTIMYNNSMIRNGTLNMIRFINNDISSYMYGDIIRMVDNTNDDHLYVLGGTSAYIATGNYSINDNQPFSSYYNEYKVKIFVDLLGKFDE